MNAGRFPDAPIAMSKQPLAPLSASLKSKAIYNSPERGAILAPRKRGPMLDPVPLRIDTLNTTANGLTLPPVHTKFLEPLLNSKKGVWKPEEMPKKDFSIMKKDPVPPTMRVELLLPHERLYYQKSVNKIKKELAAPLTYQVEDVHENVKYGRVKTLRKPDPRDMNAYKNGHIPMLSPLRIVQHG